MTLRRTVVLASWSLILLGSAAAASPPPAAPPISGIVSHLERPIADALVIFYNLGDTSLTRSRTASDGTFVITSAPVGVYDLIAYKRGFVPTLVRYWHQALPDGVSAVHIQLAARSARSAGADRDAALWELRDKLPADVLREISIVADGEGLATHVPGAQLRIDPLANGEVRSVANMSAGDNGLSRTEVGVRGGLPNGWKYDLKGDYAALSDNTSVSDGSITSGNAAGVALDVATSPDDHLTLSTRRNTLAFSDDRPVSLQTHGVTWTRNDEKGSVESVAAHYVEEANLYRATSFGTSFFPLASRTLEVKADYSRPAGDNPGVDLAMTYRHREATMGSGVGNNGSFLQSGPDADLSASSSIRVSSRAQVEGGVIGRYLGSAYGIAPVAAIRYDLGDHTTVFVRGLLRARESETGVGGTTLPLVVSVEENGEATARKGLSVGLERRDGDFSSVRLEASSQRVSEAVRAFFADDFLTDFDSVYFFDGNIVRQYRAKGTQRISDKVAATVAVQYGSIGSDIAPEAATSYAVSSNRGHFWSSRAAVELLQTKTGIAIVVRSARQQLETTTALHDNDSDKVALSLDQDLSVLGITPFGSACKLLLALESARSTTTSEKDEPTSTKRLLGGLAISF